jgi:hypothetical protein
MMKISYIYILMLSMKIKINVKKKKKTKMKWKWKWERKPQVELEKNDSSPSHNRPSKLWRLTMRMMTMKVKMQGVCTGAPYTISRSV